MTPIDIQVSRSKVKLILYMLGKGDISVLQTSIFGGDSPRNKDTYQQSRIRMAGVKTTISFIHLGFIVSPTVTCRVPMLIISHASVNREYIC